MFTKTAFIALVTNSALFLPTIAALPTQTTSSLPAIISALQKRDVVVDDDDYCVSQGIIYPCAYGTDGVPDFSGPEASDLQDREVNPTIVATSFVSSATESPEDVEPAYDPKLAPSTDGPEGDYTYEDPNPDSDSDSAFIESLHLNDEDTTSTLIPRNTGTMTYCSAPGICATLPVDGSHSCVTLDKPYTSLTFSPGLTCDIYKRESCHKRWFGKMGKVANVKGAINTKTDPRALKYEVGAARSFLC